LSKQRQLKTIKNRKKKIAKKKIRKKKSRYQARAAEERISDVVPFENESAGNAGQKTQHARLQQRGDSAVI
jgi:hypothetical protein